MDASLQPADTSLGNTPSTGKLVGDLRSRLPVSCLLGRRQTRDGVADQPADDNDGAADEQNRVRRHGG